MKSYRSRILVIVALGLLAASAGVSPAAAQSGAACTGSFTLPDEVRWQGRVMPAGDYTFALKSAALPAQIELRGRNGVVVLMTSGVSIRDKNQQSFLIIERRSGTSYVRELYLAPIGVHFHYLVPKRPKEELLAKGPPRTERIQVSSSGK